MSVDATVKGLLAIIAAALVYLCIVLTPMPTVHAQTVFGTRTPGEPTGPAEVVIVGWRTPGSQPLPVQVMGRVSVTGEVETRQSPRSVDRVVLSGWDADGASQGDAYTRFSDASRGIPVVTLAPRK
jgi:hypothetical protein